MLHTTVMMIQELTPIIQCNIDRKTQNLMEITVNYYLFYKKSIAYIEKESRLRELVIIDIAVKRSLFVNQY